MSDGDEVLLMVVSKHDKINKMLCEIKETSNLDDVAKVKNLIRLVKILSNYTRYKDETREVLRLCTPSFIFKEDNIGE